MTEETGVHVEDAIQKSRERRRIPIRSAQPFEQNTGRFQVVLLQILGNMRRQCAVGAVEQNPRLALDQQAQLGEFVLEDGETRHQFMHRSFPNRGSQLSSPEPCSDRRLTKGRTSSQFSVLSTSFLNHLNARLLQRHTTFPNRFPPASRLRSFPSPTTRSAA